MRLRRVSIAVVVLAVMGLAWFASSLLDGGVAVEVVPVQVGSVEEFVDEEGQTRLPKTYLITMPFEGRIQPITVEEGDEVKAGQVVARIVPEDLQVEIEESQAAVARLEASIRESANTAPEQTMLAQSKQFVESMDRSVDAAREQVKASQARHEVAMRELVRLRGLRERNAATVEELNRYELDEVEANVDLQTDILTARAVEAMRAATVLLPAYVEQFIARKEMRVPVLEEEKAEAAARLELVELRQRRGTMTSPVDGIVLSREVSNERHLAAGTTLLEIGRLDELEVEAEVLTQEAVRIEPGQTVEVYGAAVGPVAARGRVRRVEPAGFTKVSSLGVEQQRVVVVVEIDTSDLARLRSQRRLGVGYRTQVRVTTASSQDTLVIPRAALFRGPTGDWRTFVVRDGTAETQVIEVGLMNDDRVEVLGGLSAGDLVIPAPETELEGGTRVRPIQPTPRATLPAHRTTEQNP